MLNILNYTQLRSKLAETMNGVCEHHAPVIISRKHKEPVVIISLQDYLVLEETVSSSKLQTRDFNIFGDDRKT